MNLSEADTQKLRAALAVKTSLSGNLLTFIGLDEIRDRFPKQWERNRERIISTAMSTMQQFTNPSTDILLPRGDAGFVVLFTKLSKDEALLRAAMIKAEVLKRFTGDAAIEAVDVQVQAMELDSGKILSGALGDLLSNVDLSVDEFQAAQAQPKPAVNDDWRVLSGREQKAFRASFSDIGAQASAPVEELEQRFGYSVDDLDFAFEPHLYVTREAFSVFACQPVRYSATGDILCGYEVLPREATSAQVAALDEMTLVRARHGLVDMAVRKRVAVVVLPVSFETMSNRSMASEYLGLLQNIPSDLRKYVVIALHRCPAGIPEGRLAELVGPLKRLTRAVCIPIDSPKQPLSAIKNAGAFAVGFDLSKVAGTPMASQAYVSRLVGTARKLGLQSFVEGVDTAEWLHWCRTAKPDYMAGRELAELSDYVGPITPARSA